MTSSSSKDRGNKTRDDCQIHVDKEGESCVIKIESVGQEKILKELLERFNHFKAELDQLAVQQSKPIDEQLQKVNQKLHADLNKKFDEIKQDLYQFQKTNGVSKDLIDKILHKLDNLGTSHDEERKRHSTDLQNLKEQIPTKNDFKPILDVVQTLQSSFEKEKTKPDILARKIDAIDQKLKESQPEHLAMMKDIQTKIDPVHKASPHTSETLMKINDRVKAMHAETAKPHPEVMKKLDDIDHQIKHQPNYIMEPMKEFLNAKFLEQQKSELQSKKDGGEKLGSPSLTTDNNSPSRTPLCMNGIIPALSNLSDPRVASEIAQKLADIQTKLSSSDDHKRKQEQTLLLDEIKRLAPTLEKLKQQQQKDSDNLNRELDKSFQPIVQKLNDLTKQQDLIKNIDSKLNHLGQNLEKEHETKKRADSQPDIGKEIQTHTQTLQQAVDNLSKQQQPIIEIVRELPRKLDDLRQSQSQTEILKTISAKLDPLAQSIKTIKEDLDHQTQSKDRDNQALVESPKRPETSQEIEKALHPFSQIIKTLKDSIEQSQAQQQNETKKLNNLEQRLSKSFDTTPKSVEIINPLIDKLNEMATSIKNQQQTISDDLLAKLNEFTQKQRSPVETATKNMQSKDSIELNKKIDQLFDPLNHVNQQVRQISEKLDQIQPKKIDDPTKKPSPELIHTLKKLDEQFDKQHTTDKLLNDIHQQLTHLNQNLPAMGDIPKRLDLIKDVHDRLKNLDETIKRLPEQITTKSKRSMPDDDKSSAANLRQVPLGSSQSYDPNNLSVLSDGQTANLMANLLTLQTTIQNSENVPSSTIQQYLKRIEQSPSTQNDRDVQKLIQQIKDLCVNNCSNKTNAIANRNSPLHASNSPNHNHQRSENKHFSLPSGYLTKSRYVTYISEQTIRDNWPKLSQNALPLVEAIIKQPIDFDNGTRAHIINFLVKINLLSSFPYKKTDLERLIQQHGLEQYASSTRNATENPSKDYDKISYMMDSIVFNNMTMIGSREALIRPWDPSLLNRASSKGTYPFISGNGRAIERYPVNKDIALWMVETDDNKPYLPSEFLPNNERLNEKYERVQQPQFGEIRLKRREDETRWNERYGFTKNNRMPLVVNDLRSYFMDYDTKRKYQVHDDVPINPVCRTGIAGRGDLPFWGPNHCVVVVVLRNHYEPEVVLMKHHGNALVIPKGFYGHEVRIDNQIKIIQDPVSGQILPPNLLDYWWSQTTKLNEMNNSLNHLKRVLNEKQLKEEFAEIFSQKGCNKSVFDNGYVDHPLNTDHAWVESSVWKIQSKDWRIPEMKSMKYAIADDGKNANNISSFIWMKLTEAILIVPPFDRGILIDVLATGMPL
ncbi:unnamed protein product [Adineta ricciae]|uniref:Uncharacterized protein n=1 Tax=Adineta ricciae TaxID=249248 RepID=A0A814G984_ADIRI|nr:unnamed protein product [Adineta ricciae]